MLACGDCGCNELKTISFPPTVDPSTDCLRRRQAVCKMSQRWRSIQVLGIALVKGGPCAFQDVNNLPIDEWIFD